VERIAAAARVNKQLVFHYFDDKKGLLAAVLRACLPGEEEPLSSRASPPERLRAIVEEVVAISRQMPCLLGMMVEAELNPDLPRSAASLLARWRQGTTDRLARTLADGQRSGYFRDDLDPGAVARTCFSAALALGTYAGAGPEGAETLTGMLVDYCAWR
jgi:TetR/AcrR family transcriptional regulator